MRLVVFSHRAGWRGIVPALALAGLILAAAAIERGAEYDEGYTMLLAAGTPRPALPVAPFEVSSAQRLYSGNSTAGSIAAALRRTDVHPPLYFWAVASWRGALGTGLLATRLFSVACSLAGLALVAAIARLVGVPPIAAMLLTLGCYGFAYTGAIARGFALAQALTLGGVALLLLADRKERTGLALAAGILLGLASFTNYLAVFVGAAAILWLVLQRLRPPRLWLAAATGMALIVPADLWFFATQHGSRAEQFPPFELATALLRLAQLGAAAIFGGLPLYVGDHWKFVTGAALAGVLLLLGALGARLWPRIGAAGPRRLLAMCALAPAVGLLLLGALFNTTPIELRYLAFATPFVGLLLAGVFAALPQRPGGALLSLVLAIEAASLVGMATRPETMQPQARTALTAAALAGDAGIVLVPHGNDGVGVAGAVILGSPPTLHMRVIRRGESPVEIRTAASAFPRVVLALLPLDADSRAVLPAMKAAFAGDPCWQEAGVRPNVIAYERTEGAGASCSSMASR